MKIILIISTMRAGGAERVMSELACHFARQGHDVTLVLETTPEEKPFYPLDPKIRVLHTSCFKENQGFVARMVTIVRSIKTIRQILKREKNHVVVSFLDTVNMKTILANMGLGFKLLVSERTNPFYHRIPRLYNWMRILLYPFASTLVVQTSSVAEYFSPRISKVIIPNPIRPCDHIKTHHQEQISHIAAVGRLSPEKDHQTLIKAFKLYVMSNPHARLIIYGEGPLRPNLETLIQQEGLESHVTLFGKTDQIHQELRKADLFIFPSLYEGFPNALLEAMSLGLPVIASNVTGNVDIIQDNVNGLL
ncbi:MAG: glycosyltransferase, partial [Alphaproteobacteria bacterium]|nr:glycosyltransferase [Alphaproteobacteria bacterium]